MKLQKLWMFILCGALCTEVVADELPSAEATSNAPSVEEQADAQQLERDIKATRVQNHVAQDRNRELSAKMKELEARILELKKSMAQEDNNPTN